MEEDMQLICDLMLRALQATRGGRKIVSLVHAVQPGKETVTIQFQSGGKQVVTVTGDSGVEMMRDILRKI